jgi:uncharacterized protein (DUF1810 family)
MSNLKRFLDAQASDYSTALTEIRSGRKRSHWMWYIFPQIAGLGYSEMARRYAISDLRKQLIIWPTPNWVRGCWRSARHCWQFRATTQQQLWAAPDNIKLRSSITLFSLVPGADPVFEKVISKFFGGEKDQATVKICS